MNLSQIKVLQNAHFLEMPVLPFNAGWRFGCGGLEEVEEEQNEEKTMSMVLRGEQKIYNLNRNAFKTKLSVL